MWRPIRKGGVVIERVKSFKLLGIVTSDGLTWGAHCNITIKKANRGLYALRVLCDDLVKVYCFLVRSVLEYETMGDLVSKETVCCVGGKVKH